MKLWTVLVLDLDLIHCDRDGIYTVAVDGICKSLDEARAKAVEEINKWMDPGEPLEGEEPEEWFRAELKYLDLFSEGNGFVKYKYEDFLVVINDFELS